MKKSLKRLFCTLLGGMLLGGRGLAASDSPEALAAGRQEAMTLIGNGQRLEAAGLLLESLRAIPKNRPDLAYSAIGSVQLLMFDNEYLMTGAEREAFYGNSLDETDNAMDLFLATLIRYMDDTGISQEEATRCAVDLTELSYCDNLPVRIGALFIMSNPYYFYETKMAERARNLIAQHFPGTMMAEEAQRLVLYRARRKGPEGLRDALEAKGDDGVLRADSRRVQEDPVGGAVYTALQNASPEQLDRASVDGLIQAAANAPGWAEEYAALNTLASYQETAELSRIREAAEASIARDGDARAVFRARSLRLSVARKEADMPAILEEAHALLATGVIPMVPERSNYEELMKGVRHAADRLAELGLVEEARDLYQGLADRFPDTALSAELKKAIAALPRTESITE